MATGVRTGWFRVLLVGAILTLGPPYYACAQDSLDQVHVLPRAGNAHEQVRPGDITAHVDLVLVPVIVLDRADRAVIGLRAGDFTVLDDKMAQSIKYFSSEDTPISLTVVLDASGSMAGNAEQLRTAAMELFKEANPQDEVRLMTFGDEPRPASNLPGFLGDVEGALTAIRPHGLTALWDTMYLAIMDLKRAEYARRAIVLISDGGDNHSRHTQSEIKSLLKEAGIQVYALGIFDRNPKTREEKIGPLVLDEVASVTGGRLFSIHDPKEIPHAVTQIDLELRNQYVLGYYPSNRGRDGKWRTLKVQLVAPPQSKLRVYAKKGYYGPAK